MVLGEGGIDELHQENRFALNLSPINSSTKNPEVVEDENVDLEENDEDTNSIKIDMIENLQQKAPGFKIKNTILSLNNQVPKLEDKSKLPEEQPSNIWSLEILSKLAD